MTGHVTACNSRLMLMLICLMGGAWTKGPQQRPRICVCLAAMAQHSAGHIRLVGLPEVCRMASACHEALCTACAHQSHVHALQSDATPKQHRVQALDGRIKHLVSAGCLTSLPGCRLRVQWTLMSPSSSPFRQRSSSITLRPSALMRWCCTCATMTRWATASPYGMSAQSQGDC